MATSLKDKLNQLTADRQQKIRAEAKQLEAKQLIVEERYRQWVVGFARSCRLAR